MSFVLATKKEWVFVHLTTMQDTSTVEVNMKKSKFCMNNFDAPNVVAVKTKGVAVKANH